MIPSVIPCIQTVIVFTCAGLGYCINNGFSRGGGSELTSQGERPGVRQASETVCEKERIGFQLHPELGTGSHGKVFIGQYRTTVKYGGIDAGLLINMLRDLNIDRRDFRL